MIGYNIYRSTTENIENGLILNNQPINPTNTSSVSNYSFIDEESEFDQIYYYWLESIEQDGNSECFGPISIRIEEEEVSILPNKTILYPAYPNPFNPSTTISFNIRKSDIVNLSIFNIKGQKVKTLLNSAQTAGKHSTVWNGKDDNNNDQTCQGYY